MFHHLQQATHRGAAALHVLLQQAQSAQGFLIPQPVLGRVQHAVTAQHLQHTDKPCSGTGALKPPHMEHVTAHTNNLWVIRFHPHSLCFPLWLIGSIDLSTEPLFRDNCLRRWINNLSESSDTVQIHDSHRLPPERHYNKAESYSRAAAVCHWQTCVLLTETLICHRRLICCYNNHLIMKPVYLQEWN